MSQTPLPDVTIVSRAGCMWCTKIKAFLGSRGIKYDEIMLHPSAAAFTSQRDYWFSRTGHRSFPIVLVDGDCIGGHDEGVEYFRQLFARWA